jgi:radical SAM protein with 4Fe4S-binding SPASM domain
MIKMPDFPSGVLVETTIRCPADCIICPNKKINNRPKDMSWSLFRKIVDDCRGKQVKEFCPFIHGEPLSWKFLEKGLDYLYRTIPDTGVVIYTNGYLLDSATTSLLLRDNISEVHFSIDGFSKQIYEQHRRGLVYERVLANVTGFLAELRKSHCGIRTHVALTLTPQNQHEVDAFRLFWEGLVNTVDIIPCDGRGGEERLPAFTDGRQLPCFQAASHAYILSDGSVVPCCKDWAGYSIMGNVVIQSLESIWNSAKYRRFRDDINKGKLPDIEVCRRCLTDKL